MYKNNVCLHYTLMMHYKHYKNYKYLLFPKYIINYNKISMFIATNIRLEKINN